MNKQIIPFHLSVLGSDIDVLRKPSQSSHDWVRHLSCVSCSRVSWAFITADELLSSLI